jgi:hypothetical protein
MDLGLHNPEVTAKLFRRFHGIVDSVGGAARGYRYALATEELLRLVFMELHVQLSSGGGI